MNCGSEGSDVFYKRKYSMNIVTLLNYYCLIMVKVKKYVFFLIKICMVKLLDSDFFCWY